MRLYAFSACLVAIVATSAINAAEAARTPPQVVRTILDRHDLSGSPNVEAVLGVAELAPGAVAAWHTHPGDESGYMLRGTLILKVPGQPDRVLHAGDHFFNPRGLVHSVVAEPGGEGGAAVSTWIVDKGRPLAEPAQP